MTLLFILRGTLLFILQVRHGLVDHVAVLPVHHRALLLALRVVHCPTLCLRELVTFFPISYILEQKYF